MKNFLRRVLDFLEISKGEFLIILEISILIPIGIYLFIDLLTECP